jgi:adenylosuccinate synthase
VPLFRLGVARVYAHRHGPGPLPTEAPDLASALEEPHNVHGPWQGGFRVGWPDAVMARYARDVTGGMDGLALTHLDAFDRVGEWRLGVEYEGGLSRWPLDPRQDFARRADTTHRLLLARPRLVPASPRAIEGALQEAYAAPVVLRSNGPTGAHVRGHL